MKLNLDKPVVFFDLETTGTNTAQDRIVEISYLKVSPNGNEDMHTRRINPEMHIPEQASAVHGIYDDDVKDCPTFKEVAKEIARDFEGSDIAGFNSNRFDVPLLAEEFLRAGVDIDLSRHRFIDVHGRRYCRISGSRPLSRSQRPRSLQHQLRCLPCPLFRYPCVQVLL